jgi:hypothetical protein
LYNKIQSDDKFSTTIKTLVGDDIYPKITNTLFTAYYTSFIKTKLPTSSATRPLVYYYTNSTTIPTMTFIYLNSTTTFQLSIFIYNSSGSKYKEYIVKPDTPKVVIDLTTDLAVARPGEEFTFLKFCKVNNSEKTADEFYQNCVNILGNVFISYTYED